eukprot:jgi/Ulvmu1/12720/UM095_0024.1
MRRRRTELTHMPSVVEQADGCAIHLKDAIQRGSACSEDVIQRALDCPCICDLREGPCGASFERAFRCYLKSDHPEKGSDCHPAFAEYHRCLRTDHASQGTTHASGGLAMMFGRLLQRAKR